MKPQFKVPKFLEKKHPAKELKPKSAFNPVLKERDMRIDAKELGSHGSEMFCGDRDDS